MMDIITRKNAQRAGLKHYYTGKPCLYGHFSLRHVSSRKCLACAREKWLQKSLTQRRSIARSGRLRRYGLTIEDYNNLLHNQNGLCAICNQPETDPQKFNLSVDHCHKTNKVRALLCNKCNVTLGNVGDNIQILQDMIKYLQLHSSKH